MGRAARRNTRLTRSQSILNCSSKCCPAKWWTAMRPMSLHGWAKRQPLWKQAHPPKLVPLSPREQELGHHRKSGSAEAVAGELSGQGENDLRQNDYVEFDTRVLCECAFRNSFIRCMLDCVIECDGFDTFIKAI